MCDCPQASQACVSKALPACVLGAGSISRPMRCHAQEHIVIRQEGVICMQGSLYGKLCEDHELACAAAAAHLVQRTLGCLSSVQTAWLQTTCPAVGQRRQARQARRAWHGCCLALQSGQLSVHACAGHNETQCSSRPQTIVRGATVAFSTLLRVQSRWHGRKPWACTPPDCACLSGEDTGTKGLAPTASCWLAEADRARPSRASDCLAVPSI